METLRSVTDSNAFAYGALFGCVVVAVGAFLALFVRRLQRPAIIGVGIAVATVLALRTVEGPDSVGLKVIGALVLLGLAGYVVDDRELPPRAALLAHLPGVAVLVWATDAVRLPSATLEIPWSLRILAGVGTLVGALAVTDFDRKHEKIGLAIPLFVIAVCGLYVTAPDTEISAALLGASLPALACVWPKPVVRFSGAGASAVIGCFCWVAASESVGRESAMIGALGALGFLVIEPLGRRLPRGPRVRFGHRGRRRSERTDSVLMLTMTAVLAQLLVAWYAARVAGMEESLTMAAFVLFPALFVGMIAAPEVFPVPGKRRNRSSRSGRSRGGHPHGGPSRHGSSEHGEGSGGTGRSRGRSRRGAGRGSSGATSGRSGRRSSSGTGHRPGSRR